MNDQSRIITLSEKISKVTFIRAIRDGLMGMIPILIIGAFALVVMYFPITAYQNVIQTFLDGAIYNFFEFINKATFGVLGVYMTFSISRSYMKIKGTNNIVHGGAIFTSLLCFFMLSGTFLPNFALDYIGPKSMFLAILSGLLASSLYCKFFKLLENKNVKILSAGTDHSFNKMLSTLFPIVIVSMIFALFNVLIIKISNQPSVHDLYIYLLNKLFSIGTNNFFKGFFFVFLSSLFWFFGIHGSDALEGVMQEYFTPNLLANQALIQNGGVASNVLTKEFFDCFVLMGGCGTTICLLIAILLFSRNRSKRSLAYTASIPMVFNINELMVFGLPIVFNPIMMIPFLLTPLVCYSTAYLAISTGLVPMISSEVYWTIPVFLGGFTATNSVAGSFLQLFNIVLGVLIYFPFVKILDKASAKAYQDNYNDFVQYYIADEANLQNKVLSQMNNVYGDMAKELCSDINYDLEKNIKMYYQPQYNYEGKCIGVEALLRWKHPIHGVIYPPLVIKLAEEIGRLEELEENVFSLSLKDYHKLEEKYGKGIKLSINSTGTTVVKEEFLEFMKNKIEEYKNDKINLCLEVTEQAALDVEDSAYEHLKELKNLGMSLAIDDFSMGHTSIQYLRQNLFDFLKIDGSLVKGLSTKENCKEIISSIVELADSLSIKVLAEYVETEEQKEILHQIGCDYYQGYLYSKAKAIEEE